jgi:predicted DNA-binding transcriptional regulator AlpA
MAKDARDRLPYPPPWMDTAALAAHISISEHTVTNWVAQGILPAPRKRGGKLMWKWSEVDAWLTDGNPYSPVDEAARITEAGRRMSEARRKPDRAIYEYKSIFDKDNGDD